MKGACECCMDHGVVRPMREHRDVETEWGLVKMDLCGPHSSALTISIAREAQAAKALPRTYMIEQASGTAHEVH